MWDMNEQQTKHSSGSNPVFQDITKGQQTKRNQSSKKKTKTL
jgi:hypothetical protein